ncbi:MAG: InlB B-repeat-containing protein, partial [Lachnospiraceae bacterium]
IADRNVTWVQGVLPTDTPTRTGYSFDGWYHKGNKVTIAATYGMLAGTDTPSITLDAGWTAKTGYTVHYNSTGGTAVPDKTDVAWSDNSLLPQNNPTKANFAFGGWKLTKTETTVTSATTYSQLAGSDQITAITLDAVWNMLANNTVSYETSGGTIYTDKTNVLPTDSGLIPTTAPVRAGYEFIGWMCGTKTVTAATIYSDLTANNTVTLTAKWRARSYTISYSEGGFASVAKGWDDSGLIGGKTPTKDGNTFDGWYYGNTKITDATKVSQLIPQDHTTTVTLTAKWNEDSYTIAYASNGGSSFTPKTGVKYSASNLLPDSAPIRLGYTFTGWQCKGTPVTTDTICGTLANQAVGGVITLSAIWTAKTGYTVHYNSTGGTAVPDQTGVTWTQTALTPAVNPTRPGYELKAWVSGRTTVTPSTAYGTIAADDATGSSVTLVAQWNKAASYTVSFDTGAGTPVADKTNLTWDSSNLLPLGDIAPAGFQLTGWTFQGMTVTQSTTYGELAAISGGGPVVLTAVYAPSPSGNGKDVQGKVVEKVESAAVYKINISWGPMTFEHSTNRTWNPGTHSYEVKQQGWINEPFDGVNNRIIIANHSNADVEVSFLVTVENPNPMKDVTIAIRQQNQANGQLADKMTLSRVPTETAPAPELSAYLWLVGTPQNSSILNQQDYSKFGVIHVSIRGTGSALTPKNAQP